jgi:hypothetical protein
MDIADKIIQLHDIARFVENNIGKGQLSDDIRSCADRLTKMITGVVIETKDAE